MAVTESPAPVQTYAADSILTELQPILDKLRPACLQLEIVGSLRRGKQMVHDAEIVLLPAREVIPDPNATPGLFDEPKTVLAAPLLDAALADLQTRGLIYPDLAVKRMGDKLKRYILLNHVEQPPIELYIADELNFGNTLAIRTGSYQFSRAFMTPAPYGLKRNQSVSQRDGYLHEDGGGVIACPTEERYFEVIGVSFFAPEQRSLQMVQRLCPRWKVERI